jgi:putative ABC transport system permease protein
MSLALSTLIYEWRRYLAAMVALSCAGVLILAESGFFFGIISAYTATLERSRAEVIVLSQNAKSLNNFNGLPRRIMPLVYMHPDVLEVRDLEGNNMRFIAEGEADPIWVDLTVVDTAPDALTLPVDYTDEVRQALSVPFNVAIDRTSLRRLKVGLGDVASMNGRAVRVAAIIDGYPNMNQPGVVMSRQTNHLMNPGAGLGERVGPLMVRLKSGADPRRARDELNAIAGGQYRAFTRPELIAATVDSIMTDSLVALLMGFTVVIAVLIGIAITYMTLRGAILANVKEFASLRALGVSMGSLRLVVMELSFWVGIAGLMLTAVLMTLVTWAARAGGVPMTYQSDWVIASTIILMVIAVLSGVFTLGVLNKSQPADLLR